MSEKMTYREAVRLGISEAMEKDERVFMMGEDVGRYGGCYAVSMGLQEKFGPQRIIDTPLSEAAFTGAGIGAALNGLRPIVEIMTVNFVLLALDSYFNTFESQTPDFVARIWLGDTYAGSHEYHGRTTERHETLIPMSYLVDGSLGDGGKQNLVLNKDGPGRLYYRLGLSYAPSDLELDPLDMGFVVQRSYEAVDNPEDVSQDENGTWHIKAGARVRVQIKMVADNRRYHVALIDPLPAGLEIVNPALAVSGNSPPNPTDTEVRRGWWWWGPWFEHQNLRDERAEAFTSLLWDGVYEYSYIARATTPGHFVVPPSKAEEMYSPEVFGRSGSDIVIVE